jgi:hypothetical protein
VGVAMEFYKREFFISRIQAGYVKLKINDCIIHLCYPTQSIAYDIQCILMDMRESIDSDVLFTDDEVWKLLTQYHDWTVEDQHNLDVVLPENLDKLKIGLYEAQFQSRRQHIIRKYIQATNDELDRLYNIRHIYDHATLEGYLTYLKQQCLVERCAKYSDGSSIDWSNLDINVVLTKYYRNLLSTNVMRELARTTPWVNMWPALKLNSSIFGVTFLSFEQYSLISWSLFYDSVRESMDCPSQEVIDDDDMLDGWAILQHRKHNLERKKHQAKNKFGSKIENSDEIFVMADTIDDAKNVVLLNDPSSMAIRKNRIKQIQGGGIVREQDLADVKRDRMMQLNKAYAANMKGRKNG